MQIQVGETMDLITALIFFAAGGLFGWKYREYTALKLVKEAQDNAQRIEQALKKARMRVKVEKIGKQCFAYSWEDENFLAQGDSWDDLAKRLVERFPGKKFIMDEDNLKEQGYYK